MKKNEKQRNKKPRQSRNVEEAEQIQDDQVTMETGEEESNHQDVSVSASQHSTPIGASQRRYAKRKSSKLKFKIKPPVNPNVEAVEAVEPQQTQDSGVESEVEARRPDLSGSYINTATRLVNFVCH